MNTKVTVVVAALLASGCGSGSKGDGQPDYNSLIQGDWGICGRSTLTDVSQGLRFVGTTFEVRVLFYETTDGTCGGAVQSGILDPGTFQLRDPVPSTFGIGGPPITAYQIDLDFTSGEGFYDLIYIDTSANPDCLYFGDTTTGSRATPLDRPSVIDPVVCLPWL